MQIIKAMYFPSTVDLKTDPLALALVAKTRGDSHFSWLFLKMRMERFILDGLPSSSSTINPQVDDEVMYKMKLFFIKPEAPYLFECT